MRFASISLSHDLGGVSTGITLTPLVLPLGSTSSSGPFQLKSVTGLDPPDVDVIVSQGLNSEAVRQGMSETNREVTMLIGYNPNYAAGETISDLRSRLYPWMTPKFGLPIKLSILDSNGVLLAYILCNIKRFETDIFSKDPQVLITFTCIGTYLIGPNYTYPSLGSLTKPNFILTNPGDAPSGFQMILTMTGSMTRFDLYNRFNVRMRYNYSLVSGDIVTISSKPGERSASVNRSGVVTNLLPYQDTSSDWIMLFAGENPFQYNSSSFTFTSITIYPRYWGV